METRHDWVDNKMAWMGICHEIIILYLLEAVPSCNDIPDVMIQQTWIRWKIPSDSTLQN